jgi:hypothetical protein
MAYLESIVSQPIKKYISYLRKDRGAQITFFLGGLSWLAIFGVYDLARLFQIIFPATRSTFVQNIVLSLQQIMSVFSEILTWYPTVKKELGLDIVPQSLKTRGQLRFELSLSFFTMGILSIFLGVIGTGIYEATKWIFQKSLMKIRPKFKDHSP